MEPAAAASPFPIPERWRTAASQAAPALSEKPEILERIVERFLDKYTHAVLLARSPVAEQRAWEGFYYWLAFPETGRKPFALPESEAQALLEAFQALVQEFRENVRKKT